MTTLPQWDCDIPSGQFTAMLSIHDSAGSKEDLGEVRDVFNTSTLISTPHRKIIIKRIRPNRAYFFLHVLSNDILS